MVESVLRFLMGAILALKLCTSMRFDKILTGKKGFMINIDILKIVARNSNAKKVSLIC